MRKWNVKEIIYDFIGRELKTREEAKQRIGCLPCVPYDILVFTSDKF